MTKSRYLEGVEVSRQIFKYSFLKSNTVNMHSPKYMFSSKTLYYRLSSASFCFFSPFPSLFLFSDASRDMMRTLKRVMVVTRFFHGCLGPLDCRITGLVFGDFFAYFFFSRYTWASLSGYKASVTLSRIPSPCEFIIRKKINKKQKHSCAPKIKKSSDYYELCVTHI